ncbi:hypothetical protein LTR08_003993 [Meristemomyces frigidus]|nr:hypothetical protein LTR08_003993 [Meristemomyces frigidus]
MAPSATIDLEPPFPQQAKDATVLPSLDADERLKGLWYEHGRPFSERYANPELRSLPALLGYNAKARPETIAFLHPNGASFKQITWKEFDLIVRSLAASYSSAFHRQLVESINNNSQPTVALLGVGHSFAYFATQLALISLGARVLLLSPSNADVARDYLLATCGATGIVVEEQLLATLQDMHCAIVPLQEVPPLQSLWAIGNAAMLKFEPDDVWNSHAMMLIARMYRLFPEFAIDNWYLAFPLYHIAGISIAFSGLPNGLTLTFPPLNWPPAPGAILSAWRELDRLGHPAECLHCAPAVIEDLHEFIALSVKPDFSPLVKLKALQPGGAALSHRLLKILVALGCNVKTTYGSTEIGPPWRTIPHTRENPYCYRVRNLYPESKYLEMQPLGDGVYEPVVYKGFPLAAELWPSPDSPNPYRTNDLFVEDPPHSGLFVLQGRKDDLLVHSNGEKTNALPLQMALDACHSISKAAVFGHGRYCTSAIIQPAAEADSNRVDEEAIIASIEECCQSLPVHSRIHKSMVHILQPGQVLPVTPKGSVRRTEAESLFKTKLDALYERLESGEEPGAASVEFADLSDEDYVLHYVQQTLGINQVQTTAASFYSLGMDSHKAVRLRSALVKRFGKFPLMFIFEYSSVAALADRLASLGTYTGSAHATADHHKWIQHAISKYSADIAGWPTLPERTLRSPNPEVIYLTGATGSLGNALLETFVSNPNIHKVYCAIRGGGDRLVDSLRRRGYSSSVYNSVKLHVVSYDMPDRWLGLAQSEYDMMAAEVTIVLHNAWKLDFNLPVNEFDHDCLEGAMNLMRFANTGQRKTFAFSSSVATHLGPAAAGTEVAEMEMQNVPSLALDTGYAQSKFIVELLTQTLARRAGIPVKLFRIGQLCGHTKSGWNMTEMFPIMIKTGLEYLNAMPLLDTQGVDWLPVDVCAHSIGSLLTRSARDGPQIEETKYGVHNLVNPTVISWNDLLDVLETASGASFERIPMSEWVTRLQSLVESGSGVPGARLLGFFEDMASADDSTSPHFSTTKTQRLVPELALARPVDVALMRSFLIGWRSPV